MNQSSRKVGFAPGEQRCPRPSAKAEGHDAGVEAENGTAHSLPRPGTLNPLRPLRLCVRQGVTPSRQVRQGFAVEGGCGEIQ